MKITIDIEENEIEELANTLDRSTNYEIYCKLYNKIVREWNKQDPNRTV